MAGRHGRNIRMHIHRIHIIKHFNRPQRAAGNNVALHDIYTIGVTFTDFHAAADVRRHIAQRVAHPHVIDIAQGPDSGRIEPFRIFTHPLGPFHPETRHQNPMLQK